MKQRSPTRKSGFTLIELMIVVAIIAVIAAIAVPNLLIAKSSANESAAIAAMRQIVTCQAQVLNQRYVDMDGDGRGEFAFFGELSGSIGPRGGAGLPMTPPLLSQSFGAVQAGRISRQGYNFMIYLPDVGGIGVEELPSTYAKVNADLAEENWCCYAWPANRGTTGRRVFFANQTGELLFSSNNAKAYSGSSSYPEPHAAFPQGAAGSILGPVASGVPGSDGGVWLTVE